MPPDPQDAAENTNSGLSPDTDKLGHLEVPPPSEKRSVPAWVAVALGITCLALVGVLLAVRGPDHEDTGSEAAQGQSQSSGEPTIEDVAFGDCEEPLEPDLPAGTRLRRAGAVVTDSHVLMGAEVDAPPARSESARGGDWQLSVSLQLWAPVGDHFEVLYDFNVGSLNFGGLVSRDGRDGGLVDPASVGYFTDGNYVGVMVDRSALSAIEKLDSLSFAAQAIPQIYIDNGQPPSRTGVLTGWEERTFQWCPNARETFTVEHFPSAG